MKRTVAQEVMDEARGDPLGTRRAAAWKDYSAVQEGANQCGWLPLGLDPRAVIGNRVAAPSFPIKDIRPFPSMPREWSTVSVPADRGRDATWFHGKKHTPL
jgi:hypothetical protein